jgi:hypothetical protein
MILIPEELKNNMKPLHLQWTEYLMTCIPDIKIYVFYYKSGPVLTVDPIYQPVMAGNGLFSGIQLLQGDDAGDNISLKNKIFSELTGIYWVWKNTKQDITGSCHYRRFFTAKPEPWLYKVKRLFYLPIGLYRKRSGLIYTKNTRLFIPRILTSEELLGLFAHYDAVLPKARRLKYSVETHFQRYHNKESLKLLESVLEEKYPEFVEAFHSVLKQKRLFANNMFVLKNHHFQEFMSWWFDLLFEFERRIDLSEYTDYQERIMGFIAERLLNVWFMKKKLKCVELPVIYFKHFKYS